MKTLFWIIAFTGFCQYSFAQNGSVERSTFGIQTGWIGLYAYNEAGLSNEISLRTEVGMNMAYHRWNHLGPYDFFFAAPSITLEPRWYYNLENRVARTKDIEGNSGNYISLQTKYYPDLFTISSESEYISVIPQISLIPSWGIRRNLGRHFNYELGLGIGYSYAFRKSAGYSENEGSLDANLILRIGYRFN